MSICSNSYILKTVVCKMGSISCLNSCFSKATGLISCFRVPIWSFLLVLQYYVENHWFLSVHWYPDGLEMHRMLLVLTCQDFWTHASPSQLASFFHQVVNWYPFTWSNTYCSFLNIIKFFWTSKLESWMSKSGKGAIIIGLFRYSNSFSKTSDLKPFIEVWIDSDMFLRCFLERTILILSFNWNLDGSKMQKCPFDIDNSSVLKLSQAIGLNPSNRVSIWTALSKVGFLLKVIWCLFDKFFCAPLTENVEVRLSLSFSMTIGIWITCITLAEAVLYRRKAFEKRDFECRQNSNSSLALHDSSVDCAKSTEVQLEDSSTDEKLSINALMGKGKPIVHEKWKFEYRYFSKYISSWPFWIIRLPVQKSWSIIFFIE